MQAVLRVVMFLWSLPLTIVGFLASLCLLPRSFTIDRGVLFVSVRLMPRFKWWSIRAFTWGNVIPYKDYLTDQLARHELRHKWWCDRLGIFIVPAYIIAGVIALLRGGEFLGDKNFFEEDARDHARIGNE